MDKINEFWQKFLREKNLDKNTAYLEAFHFDFTEKAANELLALVLCGKKKATSSSLYSWKGQDMPKKGDYSIVTDFCGVPFCVIQIAKVNVLSFIDIDYDLCRKEGEDDCLESWRKNHTVFFTAESKELGYEFSSDMPVVFEEFEVVYKKG